MPAYFVAELETTNTAGMEPYRAAVPATIAQYGGRYLTRGGASRTHRGRTGAETGRHPRIPRHRGGEALVPSRRSTRKYCPSGSPIRPAAPSSSKARAYPSASLAHPARWHRIATGGAGEIWAGWRSSSLKPVSGHVSGCWVIGGDLTPCSQKRNACVAAEPVPQRGLGSAFTFTSFSLALVAAADHRHAPGYGFLPARASSDGNSDADATRLMARRRRSHRRHPSDGSYA